MFAAQAAQFVMLQAPVLSQALHAASSRQQVQSALASTLTALEQLVKGGLASHMHVRMLSTHQQLLWQLDASHGSPHEQV